MIRPGKIFLACVALLVLGKAAEAVDIETVLDRDRVSVGDSATLQVKISGAGGVELGRIPSVPGLAIDYRGESRSFQWINGRTWYGIVLSFALEPERTGTFVVPPIPITIKGTEYRSKSVKLLAVKGAARVSRPGHGDSGSAKKVYKQTVLSKEKVYTGEPLLVRYYLLHSGINFHQAPVLRELPETKWFVQRYMEEKAEESVEKRDGEELVRTHLATFLLVPTMKGKQAIRGGEIVVSYVSDNDFMSFPRQARIDLEKAEVEVMPLPEEGRPTDFNGNVGTFTMETEYDKKPTKVYDELRVRVMVKGSGNFMTLAPPVLSAPMGVKVIKGTGDARIDLEGNAVKGLKEFIYTLVPEKAGDIDCGPVRFSFFDPLSGSYRTLVSEKILLSVSGDASRGGMDLDEGGGPVTADVNYFWIVFIILGVAVVAGAVMLWERRKYADFMAMKKNGAPGAETARSEGITRANLDEFMREITFSAGGADPGEFLRSVERITGRIASWSGGLSDAQAERVRQIKERVYNIRYGGYTIGAEEVKEMSGELRDLIKELRSAVK